MVSLGHEGTQGANGQEAVVLRADRDVDYLTAHIWPLNWSWVAGDDLAGTWPTGERNTKAYLTAHTRLAKQLGKINWINKQRWEAAIASSIRNNLACEREQHTRALNQNCRLHCLLGNALDPKNTGVNKLYIK